MDARKALTTSGMVYPRQSVVRRPAAERCRARPKSSPESSLEREGRVLLSGRGGGASG